MDKRILIIIACFWVVAGSVFVYQKVYSADKIKESSYIIPNLKNNTAQVGDSIAFQDRTENASGWKWSFGDGEYSMEKNPVHVYVDPGDYQITLTAYGSFGYVKDSKKIITILPKKAAAPPEVITQAPAPVIEEKIAAPSPEKHKAIKTSPKAHDHPVKKYDDDIVMPSAQPLDGKN